MVDIIFIVLFLGACLLGARRGLVGAFTGLLGTLISYFASVKLLAPLLTPLAVPLVTPYCRDLLVKAVGQGGLDALQIPASQAAGQLDQVLGALGLPPGMTEGLGDALAQGSSTVLDALSQGLARQVAPMLAFLAGFLLCKIALWLLVHLCADWLPGVRTINKGAGLCLGALGGAALVVLLCLGLRAFAPQGIGGLLDQQAIAQSQIGSLIYSFLPPA